MSRLIKREDDDETLGVIHTQPAGRQCTGLLCPIAIHFANCNPHPGSSFTNLTSAPPTAPPATVPPATSSMLKPGDQLGDMVITTGQGENPMIWDYCDPIITEPGPLTVTRECEVPAVPQSFLALVKPFT